MLSVEGLTKSFAGDKPGKRRRGESNSPAEDSRVLAVDGVSLDVHEGELFTLLGPSGCGKTTTLRSVAGLEHPERGRIDVSHTTLFDSQRRINVPPNRRGLGMVFQSYAIWPHMSVFRNVAFPLESVPRRRRLRRSEIATRVQRMLEVTELGDYADRPATKLSGGQQQRLALARAMVTQPALVLLDEPLSNLDAKLRESMRFELKRLQRELGLTAVYVTHDQAEALVLSSRMAVMQGGQVVQTGKPRQVYSHPNCRFVAEFIGTSNFIHGVVSNYVRGQAKIETSEGVFWSSCAQELPVGSSVLLSLRPENLSITTESSNGAIANEWRGSVSNRAFLGDSVDHMVAVSKHELRVRSNPATSIRPGTEVYLSVAPDNVTIVPD